MQHCLSFLGRFRSYRHAGSDHVRRAAGALTLLGFSACSSPDAGLSLGQSEQPILRGQIDRDHPQIMLLANDAGFLCTGTLIQVRAQTGFLLTAAHCVTEEDAGAKRLPAEQFKVTAGTDFRDSSAVFGVDQIRVHPDYEGAFAENDVAVVRMDLGDSQPPPAIPPLTAADDALKVNDRLLLVGYGQTESDDENSVRRQVARKISGLDSQVISYSQQDGKGTCFGDSGGPGLVSVNGEERVASVTSGAVGGDDSCSGGFGIGMRVSAFAEFIDGALSEDN